MAAGNKLKNDAHSLIVDAIAAAEKSTTGEIRVHLSRSWFEKDVYRHAERIFQEFGMARTAQRNAVLLYVNLRKHRFAIVGDEGIHKAVGQSYWEKIAKTLSDDLRSTHYERAIADAVHAIGAELKNFFPAELQSRNPNELPNDVTRT